MIDINYTSPQFISVRSGCVSFDSMPCRNNNPFLSQEIEKFSRTKNGKYNYYTSVIDINWLTETREIILKKRKKLNRVEYSDNWVFSEASSS